MLYGAAAARELGLLDDRRIVLPPRLRRGDRERGRLRPPARGRADRPRALAMLTAEPTGGVVWHACRGAITLRVDARGPRGARRPGARGRQRLRAHDPRRRAARRRSRTSCSSSAPAFRSRATRPAARCSSSAAQPAPAPNSTPSRRGVVLRRPALQPGGGARDGARAPDRHDPRGRRGDRRRRRDRGASAASRRQHRRVASRRRGARRLRRVVEGAEPRVPAVPRRARHALVRPARHPGLRLRRRAARRLPRPRRVIDEAAMRRCAAVYALLCTSGDAMTHASCSRHRAAAAR